jgi:hypothetical protein
MARWRPLKVGLDVLDYLLHVGRALNPLGFQHLAMELDGILLDGGSKWCMSADHDSLEERVASDRIAIGVAC